MADHPLIQKYNDCNLLIPRRVHNLLGISFNELTPIKYIGVNKKGVANWLCRCTCGEICVATSTLLKSGDKQACTNKIDHKLRLNPSLIIDRILNCYTPEPNTGCWLWDGHFCNYPHLQIGNKTLLVHRVVYSHFHGSISPGLVVRHKCDTPICINPDHLEIGTHKQNGEDKAKRNLRIKGENSINAKLTDEQVVEIRRLRANGMKLADLKKMYGVSDTLISMICRHKIWHHIK